MKSFLSIAVIAATLLSTQAHAWMYRCSEQSISHQTLNNMSVSNSYGDFVTLRLFVEGKPYSVPTMLANGTNDFISHDGDAEISINPLTDETGSMMIWIKVKSLGIKGNLDCKSGY